MRKYSELIAFIYDNGDHIEQDGVTAFPKDQMDLVTRKPEAKALLAEAIEAGAILDYGSSYAVTDDIVKEFGDYDPDNPLGSQGKDVPSDDDDLPDYGVSSTDWEDEADWEDNFGSVGASEDPVDDDTDDEDDADDDDDWEDEWESETADGDANGVLIFAIVGIVLGILGLILRAIGSGLLATLGLALPLFGVICGGLGLFMAIKEKFPKKHWIISGAAVLVSLAALLVGFVIQKEPDVPREAEPAVVQSSSSDEGALPESDESATSQEASESQESASQVNESQASDAQATAPTSNAQGTTPADESNTVTNPANDNNTVVAPSASGPSNTYADNVEISIEPFQIAQDSQGRTRSRLPITLTNVTQVPLAYNFTIQAFDSQGNPVGSPDFILGYTLQPNTPQVVYTYEYRLPDEIEELTAPGVTFQIVDISSSGLDAVEGESDNAQ